MVNVAWRVGMQKPHIIWWHDINQIANKCPDIPICSSTSGEEGRFQCLASRLWMLSLSNCTSWLHIRLVVSYMRLRDDSDANCTIRRQSPSYSRRFMASTHRLLSAAFRTSLSQRERERERVLDGRANRSISVIIPNGIRPNCIRWMPQYLQWRFSTLRSPQHRPESTSRRPRALTAFHCANRHEGIHY